MSSAKPEIAHVLMTDRVGYSQISIERKAVLDAELLTAVLAFPDLVRLDEQDCIRLDSGDGISLVFFGDPLLAIKAAQHLQKTVSEKTTVKLRIGLHSGLVTRRRDANEKMNVSGPGIDKAQRAMACSTGEGIVMTEFFAENLRAYEGWRDQLVDLGERTVKHGEVLHLYGVGVPRSAADKGLDVVILYRRMAKPDDRLLALLEERLPSLGFSVYIDRHLKIGVEWAQSIEKWIRDADAVIALISEAAETSEMLEAELEIAFNEMLKKGTPKILPIRVGRDEPVKGPLSAYVSSLQYGVWAGPEDDESVLKAIKLALTNPVASPVELAESDTGGLAPESVLYIERNADAHFHQALKSKESILLVKGPGKSAKRPSSRGEFKPLLNREPGWHLPIFKNTVLRSCPTKMRFIDHWRGRWRGRLLLNTTSETNGTRYLDRR